MKAYIIGEITITDPVRYEDYKKLTLATLQPYGGKFVVRGGPRTVLEGGWEGGRVVVLEFPSVEQAKAWYSGDVYAPAKGIRQSASQGKFILVEGIE
jgi:uncharacterized protein (DUF1330 family)